MNKNGLLLYGANGYTGLLIARMAQEYSLQPILAGRNAEKLQAVSLQTGWPYRVFSLENPDEIAVHLQDIKVVLHAAGPFALTALPMVKACIQSGTHYLDITGETEVFEKLAGLDQQAKAANIMIMPGTGFDVVPTDCMALTLKNRLPDADTLELAFGSKRGGVSHGTATSMLRHLGGSGGERRNGRLVPVPLGKRNLEVTVDGFSMFTMSIPWGDISTAWRTTGIPNITTYTRVSKKTFYGLKCQAIFNPILRTRWFRAWLQKKIDQAPPGPSDEQRLKARSYIWGRVSNAAGHSVSAGFTAPEGYTLTALCSLNIAKKVLAGEWKPGYQTPAGCYGKDLIFETSGVGSLAWL